MKNKLIIFSGLIILISGVIYFAVLGQQKIGVPTSNFSGEWKSKQSISMGGNIVCSYINSDRMNSKTMKIEEQRDFLTIATQNLSSDIATTTRKEKLTFDGEECQINDNNERGKKFTVMLSPDRKTMIVKSIVHLMTATPYHTNIQKKSFVYVTEVWELSNDGKSLSVLANATSNLFKGERNWKTVFEKVK